MRTSTDIRQTAARNVAAALLLLSLPGSGRAQTLTLGPGSRLWLEGDSTLHPFSSTATRLTASFVTAPGLPVSAAVEEAIRGGKIRGLVVVVPVKGLKSGESGLDKNLWKALRADAFPDIAFTMGGYRLEVDSATAVIVAWGELTVAGARRPETLRGSLGWRDGGAVIDGAQPLLMTDFGIRPPTFLFDALKTSDRVTVRFHLEVGSNADGRKTDTR